MDLYRNPLDCHRQVIDSKWKKEFEDLPPRSSGKPILSNLADCLYLVTLHLEDTPELIPVNEGNRPRTMRNPNETSNFADDCRKDMEHFENNPVNVHQASPGEAVSIAQLL